MALAIWVYLAMSSGVAGAASERLCAAAGLAGVIDVVPPFQEFTPQIALTCPESMGHNHRTHRTVHSVNKHDYSNGLSCMVDANAAKPLH